MPDGTPASQVVEKVLFELDENQSDEFPVIDGLREELERMRDDYQEREAQE